MKKHCKQCGGEFETENFKQKTCSRECRYKAITMYTEEDKAYMAANYGKLPTKELMLYYGLDKPDSLRKLAGYWRKNGYPIPELRNYKIGDIVKRMERGRPYELVKTETGWQRVKSRTPALKAPKAKKVKVQTVVRVKKATQSELADARRLHRKQQLQAQRLPTRIIDLSTAKRIHIPELRMDVYVKPGRSEEEVRTYWLDHYQFMNRLSGANNC